MGGGGGGSHIARLPPLEYCHASDHCYDRGDG